MRHTRANLAVLACAAIWGFAFLFQKNAATLVGPFMFVAARSLLAAFVLAPLALIEHRRSSQPLSASQWRLCTAAGVLFLVAAVLQQWGIATASVTNTAFLTALYVVATPLLAWPLLHQRPSRVVLLAAALSFVGTWLLGGAGLTTFGAGELLVLASVVFWALHVVVLGFAAPVGRPVLLNTVQFAVAGALGLVGAWSIEGIDWSAVRSAAIDIAFVGIFSSAVTFTIFAAALRRTTAAEACVIASTEALFAALAAYLLLGETLSMIAAAGAAMILGAALAVQLLRSSW